MRVALRPFGVGDLGLIIHHQALLYHRAFGWNVRFEALAAEIAAKFIQNFKPDREQCWVAESQDNGKSVMLGSIMIVEDSAEIAKLRMLWVAEQARGHGIGGRLVNEAIAFSRAKNYKIIRLWTNDILHSARKIYQSRGFKLMSEEKHEEFGEGLIGQTWELVL